MTPEWRCRNRNCGHEWDATLEEVARFPQRVRPAADIAELEARRLEAERKENRLRFEEDERRRKAKAKDRAVGFAIAGFFIGLIIGNLLSWSSPGIALGGILLGAAVYWLAEN